ncbi:MAG TPA: cytochrome C oxidase subunit IV family protein [Anaeromyxobacteraceae bacterium]|jgi:cytochrome c oxidase subunit 4|nr:cytochrome C oxidase subunit IV family protein [Anaeromyxobacteraceae bacterium]
MAHENAAELEEHHGAGRYLAVWAALCVLTVGTFLASRLSLGPPWHLLVALLIAGAKASLVALFFMHLWDQPGVNRLVFLTSLVFVALLIGLVLLDNATRFPLANPPNERTLRFQAPGGAEPHVRPGERQQGEPGAIGRPASER